MRILEVIPSLETGGAQRVVGILAEELPGLGAEVTVVSLYPDRLETLGAALRNANVPLRHLGKHRGPDLRMYSRLASVIASVRPDILHTHLHSLRYAWTFCGARGQPRGVHTIHNLPRREAGFAGRAVRRFALRRGWRIACCSAEVMQEAERVFGPSGLVEIPNGVRGESFEAAPLPRPADSEVRLICTGRLSRQKAPLSVLEAFTEARRESAVPLRLEFLGDGPLAPALRSEVRRRGLAGGVEVSGERDDVAARLARSHLFVLGSLFEGLPMAVIEAMLSGLPVVATDVGGVRELVEDGTTGYLVPPGDTGTMARRIAELAATPDLRARMGEAGRRKAREGFSATAMARRYLELFRSCLDSGPSPT